MEALRLPDNMKVHFAGTEVQNSFIALKELGVSYGLFTCFPFVDKAIFGKTKCPIMPLKSQKKPAVDIPAHICQNMKHVIQDSGLFTLMFGARKGIGKEVVFKWYDGLVEFTLNHGQPCTCVEIDCQKILGVDQAWEFREKLRKDLPNNRIINVFHLEDGMKGLDRLIEYSDYIAISVPELRIANKKEYVYTLASYIKEKKPDIDIHLLGCTEVELLRKCNFCTTCDSSSWTSPMRYGCINDYHVSDLDNEKVKAYFGEHKYNKVAEYLKKNVSTILVSVEAAKRKHEKYAGNQDYYYCYEKDK